MRCERKTIVIIILQCPQIGMPGFTRCHRCLLTLRTSPPNAHTPSSAGGRLRESRHKNWLETQSARPTMTSICVLFNFNSKILFMHRGQRGRRTSPSYPRSQAVPASPLTGPNVRSHRTRCPHPQDRLSAFTGHIGSRIRSLCPARVWGVPWLSDTPDKNYGKAQYDQPSRKGATVKQLHESPFFVNTQGIKGKRCKTRWA